VTVTSFSGMWVKVFIPGLKHHYVEDLKRLVSLKMGISRDGVILIHNGRILPDDEEMDSERNDSGTASDSVLPPFLSLGKGSQKKSLSQLGLSDGDRVTLVFSKEKAKELRLGCSRKSYACKGGRDSLVLLPRQRSGRDLNPRASGDEAKEQDSLGMGRGTPRQARRFSSAEVSNLFHSVRTAGLFERLLRSSRNDGDSEASSESAVASRPVRISDDKKDQLVRMGFSAESAERALIISGNDVNLASNWLIEHSDDPSIHRPLDDEERSRLSSMGAVRLALRSDNIRRFRGLLSEARNQRPGDDPSLAEVRDQEAQSAYELEQENEEDEEDEEHDSAHEICSESEEMEASQDEADQTEPYEDDYEHMDDACPDDLVDMFG
jgi:hypothetical protein